MTPESRLRLISESPTWGPAVLDELDALLEENAKLYGFISYAEMLKELEYERKP